VRLHFILAAVCCLSGCSERDEILVNSTVNLDRTPLTIRPRGTIAAPGHFSLLCIKVAAPFKIDGLAVRGPSGDQVRIQATLTTVDGQEHHFRSSAVLQGGFICLQESPWQSQTTQTIRRKRINRISISSSEPFQTSQIRWISSEKM
jgi:hypothetical protein